MSAFLFAGIMALVAAAGGAGDPKEGAGKLELVKTIEISGDSFSAIYPAVWLHPGRGTIHPLVEKSEDPPIDGAMIWIEPRDPEFAIGPGIGGVKLLVAGFGEEVFSSLPPLEKGERIGKLERALLVEDKKPVIVIESETAGILAVVMIEAVDREAGTMRLRWRSLSGR